MNTNILKSIFLCVFLVAFTQAQKIATIQVKTPASDDVIYSIVSTDLDKITFLPGNELALYLISGDKKQEVPVQINNTPVRTIFWMTDPGQSGSLTYELHKVKEKKQANTIESHREKGALIFSSESGKFLAYQFETMYPPEGVDPAYKRSGYIHPLWSPQGQVLTRIQPADHYHHYGIWNPWTHVLFEKDTVDFWNLKKQQGTVRHDKFISVENGSVFGEMQVVHEHVVFKKDGTEKTALNELQTVRIYKQQGNTYIVDLTINLNCASASPVTFLEYRYGGFGWRGTEQWTVDNSEMLSSAGKTRKDIDNTLAEWFYVQGEVDNAYAGIMMMSHPTNFNHPQPTRMWGIPDEGPGDVFACFSPTRNTDWPLEPGKSYTLRYRFVVYNGHFDAQTANQFWQNYSVPTDVVVRISE